MSRTWMIWCSMAGGPFVLGAAGCRGGGGGSACRPEMVRVPAGAFYMGCDDPETCQADEAPAHLVTVPEFEVDSCEVTVAQYGACVQAGACAEPSTYSPQCNFRKEDRENHPVNCVTYDQAQAYCAWAGKRLCTEAEWEKAARGGCELYQDCAKETRRFPWGDEEPACARAVYGPCSCRGTCEAGVRASGASPYGVLDLAGNVWEWVADTYHPTYDQAPADGGAWSGGQDRVYRGGSFLSPATALRASNRTFMKPDENTDALGFRCCRTPAPASGPGSDATADDGPDTRLDHEGPGATSD